MCCVCSIVCRSWLQRLVCSCWHLSAAGRLHTTQQGILDMWTFCSFWMLRLQCQQMPAVMPAQHAGKHPSSSSSSSSSAHLSSSMGTPGRGVTSEPVAIMMFFVLICVLLPSFRLTDTSLGLLILPQPCT